MRRKARVRAPSAPVVYSPATKSVTPAVLSLVHELSGGRSVEVNRLLIADNAGLAAEVAVAHASVRT